MPLEVVLTPWDVSGVAVGVGKGRAGRGSVSATQGVGVVEIKPSVVPAVVEVSSVVSGVVDMTEADSDLTAGSVGVEDRSSELTPCSLEEQTATTSKALLVDVSSWVGNLQSAYRAGKSIGAMAVVSIDMLGSCRNDPCVPIFVGPSTRREAPFVLDEGLNLSKRFGEEAESRNI